MSARPQLEDRVPDLVGLSGILAELKALRAASQKRRYKGSVPPEMPSKEAVARIVEGLVAVLFPRHFGPPGLTAQSTDAFLALTLEQVLVLLVEQARRELVLTGAANGADPRARAIDIGNRFALGLPKVRSLLDSDIRAAFDGDPAAKTMDEIVFCYPGFAALIRHRLAHELYLLGVPMLARIVAELAHSQTAIDIHPGAQIGDCFFIDHGTGVVIGETAVIGRRVRIYQAVTLGAKRFEADENGALVKGRPRHPVIEDDVVIYAGATILGRVTIGAGSSIGGNVWLTTDVPPGSNITQARARTVAYDNGGGI